MDHSTDPTALYYNQYRHYRPDLGRYLTPDPIGIAGGLNLYSYAGQNPINYTDPLGLDRYRFSLQALLGITVGWGSDKGVSFFDVGIRASWDFGFSADWFPGGEVPRHFRLEQENDERAWVSGYVEYVSCRTGVKNTPASNRQSYYRYHTFGLISNRDDYIPRGIGSYNEAGRVFTNKLNPVLRYEKRYNPPVLTWPPLKKWFRLGAGSFVFTGFSWK